MKETQITQTNFRKFIFLLAETYGKEITQTRAEAYEVALCEVLMGQGIRKAIQRITLHCEYFPTPKQVHDLYAPKQLNHQEQAETLVDNFIAYLLGEKSYSEIGSETMAYCKARFNADKYAYQQGKVNLDFKRREWIEKARLDYERQSFEQPQIEAPKVLQLVNSTIKKLES